MESFTDLDAWKKGLELVKEVYLLTSSFPKAEQYGLTSQLRKASVSVLANLAEGFSRSTSPDKAHKYTIARGECSETRALLLVSVALGFCKHEKIDHVLVLSDDVGKLLSGLIHKFS